jgi:hypothetical protein
MQPELWDPVTGTLSDLPQFETNDMETTVPLKFAEAQSFFIIFRNKVASQKLNEKLNFPVNKEVLTLSSPWQVKFDPKWGGPVNPVTFLTLQDWTKSDDPGIKYYSGTAVYKTLFDLHISRLEEKDKILSLDLGVVNHIAHVKLNNQDLGIIWTAPWRTKIPAGLLKQKGNELTIEVTNVWANRLIGDEQEPSDCEWLPGHMDSGSFLKEFPDWFLKDQPRPSKGRYCFTTWNYFTKDSPLVPSGLLGPVRIMKSE